MMSKLKVNFTISHKKYFDSFNIICMIIALSFIYRTISLTEKNLKYFIDSYSQKYHLHNNFKKSLLSQKAN